MVNFTAYAVVALYFASHTSAIGIIYSTKHLPGLNGEGQYNRKTGGRITNGAVDTILIT
jgi:hypothetical protein